MFYQCEWDTLGSYCYYFPKDNILVVRAAPSKASVLLISYFFLVPVEGAQSSNKCAQSFLSDCFM